MVLWLVGGIGWSAEAPEERYYSAAQPPTVADLMFCVQCIMGQAVGGGSHSQEQTSLHLCQ